ncbi:MAG: OmpA family protein [Deltaproteobacteria bacterium]|nr:OmpA family protein [Deltaproteobacteria bacterium]
MAELNATLATLGEQIEGAQALAIIDATGLVAAAWGAADFDTVSAELSEVWKQAGSAETVSASGSVQGLEVHTSRRRWTLVPLDDDLLTIATDPSLVGRSFDVTQVREAVLRSLRGQEPLALCTDVPAQATATEPPQIGPNGPAAVVNTAQRDASRRPWAWAALAVGALAIGALVFRLVPGGATPAPAHTPEQGVASDKNAEVARLAAVLNQTDGVAVAATVGVDGEVVVRGTVSVKSDLIRIRGALAMIPGVRSVRSDVSLLESLPIGSRIYFGHASAAPIQREVEGKLPAIRTFLAAHPELRLRIVGHADPSGTESENLRLAQARADAVLAALVGLGAPAASLTAEAAPKPPPDVDALKPLWQGRCVRFLPVVRP